MTRVLHRVTESMGNIMTLFQKYILAANVLVLSLSSIEVSL